MKLFIILLLFSCGCFAAPKFQLGDYVKVELPFFYKKACEKVGYIRGMRIVSTEMPPEYLFTLYCEIGTRTKVEKFWISETKIQPKGK